MIKVLLWDLDNTLLDFSKAEKAAIAVTFDKMNMSKFTTKMYNSYTKIDRLYWHKIEKKELSKDVALVKRYEDLFALYGLDTSMAKEFNDNYAVALADIIVYKDKSLDILTSLKGKYKQYIVSNGVSKIQHKRLKNSGIDKIVDGVFISDDIGYEKPSIEFFDYVLNHIEYKDKSEIMIIGDTLTSDIRGGNLAGIHTCWYNPQKKGCPCGYKVELDVQSLGEFVEVLKLINYTPNK